MTENVAVIKLKCMKRNCGMSSQNNTWKPNALTTALDMAIKAFEEIQQYRLIGTVEEIKSYTRLAEKENARLVNKIRSIELELNTYKAIGTVSECREAVEKQQKKTPDI